MNPICMMLAESYDKLSLLPDFKKIKFGIVDVDENKETAKAEDITFK